MSFNQDSVSFFQFATVMKSTLVAFAISAVLIIVLGLIFYFTDIPESTLPWISAGIIFLSVTCGGLCVGRLSSTKGLLHGLAVGICFFLIIWLISFILPSQILLLSSLHKLLLSLTSGALGGILGVGSA